MKTIANTVKVIRPVSALGAGMRRPVSAIGAGLRRPTSKVGGL